MTLRKKRAREGDRQTVTKRDREGKKGIVRERERKRERETQKHTHTHRDMQRQTDRQTEKKDRHDRQIHDRQTDRQTDKKGSTVPYTVLHTENLLSSYHFHYDLYYFIHLHLV